MLGSKKMSWSFSLLLAVVLSLAAVVRGHEVVEPPEGAEVGPLHNTSSFTSIKLACGANATVSASGAGYQWRSIPDGALECSVSDSTFSCILGNESFDGEDARVEVSLQANTSVSVVLDRSASATLMSGVSLNGADVSAASQLLGQFCNDNVSCE